MRERIGSEQTGFRLNGGFFFFWKKKFFGEIKGPAIRPAEKTSKELAAEGEGLMNRIELRAKPQISIYYLPGPHLDCSQEAQTMCWILISTMVRQ